MAVGGRVGGGPGITSAGGAAGAAVDTGMVHDGGGPAGTGMGGGGGHVTFVAGGGPDGNPGAH